MAAPDRAEPSLEERIVRLERAAGVNAPPAAVERRPAVVTAISLAALGVLTYSVGFPNHFYQPLFAALIIMSILGIVLFAIIEIAEKLLIPWHASRRTSNSASTAAA